MTFESEGFTANVKNVMAQLETQGYKTTTLWSNFKSGVAYKGINSAVTTAEGDLFELQFHTPESFEMKQDINHSLYEQARVLEDDDSVKLQLDKQMISNSATVELPPGVQSIKLKR